MADITESNTWEPVRQWEITDPALGGTSGVMNTPLKSLVNRSAYLKNIIESIIAGTTSIIGILLNGSTVANSYTNQQSNTAVASAKFVQDSIALATGRRNMILNGDMKIAQRGNAFTLVDDGVHFTLDRWIIELSGRDTEIGQELDAHRADLVNAEYSMRNKLKAGTGTLAIRQRIESAFTFAGNKCIVQFCMGAPFAFDFTVKVKQYMTHAQIAAGTPHWEDSETISAASGYRKYTSAFTVPGFDDVSLAVIDASNCFEVSIETTDGRDIDFWISQVQVESGIIATAFEFRDDLNECLRFFQKDTYHERYDDSQVSDGASRYSVFRRQYYHKKRIIPTITKENITYTELINLSDISNIEKNACTLEIQPTSLNGGTITHREIELDLLIDAEIT